MGLSMAGEAFSTRSIDYLQRSGQPPEATTGAATGGAAETRRLLHVTGIGRPTKDPERPAQQGGSSWRPSTADLITGLYGYRIPLAFRLLGGADGVRVELGTWSARTDVAPDVQDRRSGVVESLLRGLYPYVGVARSEGLSSNLPLSGLALGVPAPRGTDASDGAGPVDRVIRSLAGSTWEALVLGYPVSESAVGQLRAQALNEVREVESRARSEGAPSPLAEQYVQLLRLSLSSLGDSLATGAWRTAVYLLGDHDSYPRLATAWRSVFSGEGSLPEPVRVFDRPDAGALARTWVLPDLDSPPGPGHYRRPFELQTLLTTSQLAAYAHLPQTETPGFAVDLMPRFDSVTAGRARDGSSVPLGRVLHQRRETGQTYSVALDSLTRHTFIAGTTGSGKTNTIFALLTAADATGVPFLVVEPAKTEYRALLHHPRFGERLRVFTPGKASVGPLLLNPFEVPAGTAVSEHLDLVRAAFGAAFGMWTPLPQILERCLHAVYEDRGWDLRTNQNVRLVGGGDPADAFPTLTDLVAKAGEVIQSLGYDDKVTGDMYAALTTRLDSLRRGGKGALFDVARSTPMDQLLGGPAVVELEGLGDESDRAFLSGLLLIRLAEHRRSQGQRAGLVHLLVIEEAHRLLANVSTGGGEEMANPRGQAVETFSNLLSEIRAYGQGVIVADQIPVRLAPDVVKNTTLKVAHRMVSADDRSALGAAMAMDDGQTRALTSLAVGEAAVFGAEEDAPLLVRVPLAKMPDVGPPDDAAVATHMATWRSGTGEELLLARPFCVETCSSYPTACEAARTLVGDEYVQQTVSRTVVSLVDEAGSLDRLWADLVSVLRARTPPGVGEPELLRSFAGHASDWLASRRGAQKLWSYVDTARFRDDLRHVLLAKTSGEPAETARRIEAFRATATDIHRRRADPYPACGLVCAQDPPLCLYRSAVSDLVGAGRYRASWQEAEIEDSRSAEGRRERTWTVCQDAAYELVEFPDADSTGEERAVVDLAARRAAMCFEQQMLAADRTQVPRTARRVLARVLRESGL